MVSIQTIDHEYLGENPRNNSDGNAPLGSSSQQSSLYQMTITNPRQTNEARRTYIVESKITRQTATHNDALLPTHVYEAYIINL
jgi:hypothetical protein